jgi:hypothetical protein
MRSIRVRRATALAAILIAASPITTPAAPGDTTADRVVGQPTATTNDSDLAEVTAANPRGPSGLAFDASGDLFVADFRNHRVLGYRAPITTGEAAELFVGQPGFATGLSNNGGVSVTKRNTDSCWTPQTADHFVDRRA